MTRSLAALVLVLATGGWVCDSSEPCQGELVCPSDIADDLCCPQGSPYRCNGHCSATPECSDYLICKYPDDPGSGLCTAGSYRAAIQGITCKPNPSGYYNITVSGTVFGCGATPVVIKESPSSAIFTGGDCGSWPSNTPIPRPDTIECAPGSDAPGATTWEIKSILSSNPAGVFQVDASVSLEIDDDPVLAHEALACPP